MYISLDEQITLGPTKRPPKNKFAHSRFALQLHDEVRRRLLAFGIPTTDNLYPEDSWASDLLSNTTFGRAQLPPKEIAVSVSHLRIMFGFARYSRCLQLLSNPLTWLVNIPTSSHRMRVWVAMPVRSFIKWRSSYCRTLFLYQALIRCELWHCLPT